MTWPKAILLGFIATFIVALLFLPELWSLWVGVWSLDAATYQQVMASPDRATLAWVTFLLATFATAVGQSGVLFLNRVPRDRFWFSLLLEQVNVIVLVAVWIVALWLTAQFVLSTAVSLAEMTLLVFVSLAPLLLSFLVIAPYVGQIFYYVLRFYAGLALLVGARALYALTLGQMLAALLLGWFCFYLFTRLPLPWVRRARAWLWRKTIGRNRPLSTDELQAEWVTAVRQAIHRAAAETNHGPEKTGDQPT